MTFFDKLALALLLWGLVGAYPGGMAWWINNNQNGKRAFYIGVACLVSSTLVWMFT